MGIKKVVSYEFGLNDNDLNEIRKALPELAKRQLSTGDSLCETSAELYDKNFLDLLENRFKLSLAKEARGYLENNDCCLEDLPGFGETIEAIDIKVDDYIESNSIQLKASFFENEEELEEWYEGLDSRDIANALWDVIRSNQNDPFVDKIISELGKYH